MGQGLKKAVKWVSDKVLTPMKPVIQGVAKAIDPITGGIASKAVNTVYGIHDRARPWLNG